MNNFKEVLEGLAFSQPKWEIYESVIDPPHKDRASFLFNKDGLIKTEIKKQIYDIIKKWKEQINFSFEIKSIHLKGSLLGYQWNQEADLDISVDTSMSKEQIEEISKIIPDGNFIQVEGKDTLHPLDFFITGKDDPKPSLNNFDFYYDLGNNKWLKESEPYKSDLSVDYVMKVGNFFVNGINIAIGNADKNMLEYDFYESIVSSNQDFNEEERKKLLARKYDDIKISLEELRLAKFIFLSLRREGYRSGEKIPFYISIQDENKNPHTLFGEVFQKSLERMKIRENLEKKTDEVKKFIEDKKPIEEK